MHQKLFHSTWAGICIFMTLILSMIGCNQEVAVNVDVSQSNSTAEFPVELVSFVPYEVNPVFQGIGLDTWDCTIRERGYILREGSTYFMWYTVSFRQGCMT